MIVQNVAIFAGPRTDYVDVVLAALNERGISAKIIEVASAHPKDRPNWAVESELEVYLVVPEAQRVAALELILGSLAYA